MGRGGGINPVVVARAILASRRHRRRAVLYLTGLLVAALGIGVRNLGGIARHPWWWLVWWCGVAGLCVGVFLLALYDLLAVRRGR